VRSAHRSVRSPDKGDEIRSFSARKIKSEDARLSFEKIWDDEICASSENSEPSWHEHTKNKLKKKIFSSLRAPFDVAQGMLRVLRGDQYSTRY
jgi:hypothetical protein